RKALTGAQGWRVAAMLTALGRARAALPFDSARFALAEANLLEGRTIFVSTRGESHIDTRHCTQAVIDFYSAWDKAEPGKGYDAKAALWKAKLGAAPATLEKK